MAGFSLKAPAPKDFDRWEKLVAEGKDVSVAAKELGFRGSLVFKRADPSRHAEVIALSRDIREGIANERGERWALAEDAEPSLKLAYLKAESPKYRQGDKVTLEGSLDVRSDVAESIDRFTAAVAAASVRAAAGAGAAVPALEPGRRGEGVVGLPVGGVAGPSESGGA